MTSRLMSPREIDDVKKKKNLRKFVKNGLENIPAKFLVLNTIRSEIMMGGGGGGIRPPPVQSTLQKPGINRVKIK